MATSSLASGFLSAGIALCGASIGFAAVHHYTSRVADPLGVSVSPSTIDLGHLGQYASVDRVIHLSNPNDFPIQIKNVVPSCGCTTAQAPDFIPPHGDAPLTVHFNALSRNGSVQEDVVISFAGQRTESVSILITGNITREIALSQTSLVLTGKPSAAGSLTLTRLDGKPLRVAGIVSPAVLRTKISPLSASAVRVTTWQNGPGLAGAQREEVTLNLNDSLVPTLTIPVGWTTSSRYRSVPAAVNFGSVALGAALAQKVQLSGPHASRLHIVSLPPGWKAHLQPVGPGRVDLTLKGSPKGGLLHSSVVLATRNQAEPNIAVPIYAVVETSADVCSVQPPAQSSR